MEAMNQITGADGNLLPSKAVSSNKRMPVLNIIVSTTPEDNPVLSDESDDSSDEVEGFFVELSLSCTNEDGDYADHSAIFNFGSESNYMDHASNGFEDFDLYFDDAINVNFPGWTYADEWEELHIHGSEIPEDHDGAIVDID